MCEQRDTENLRRERRERKREGEKGDRKSSKKGGRMEADKFGWRQ